MQNSIYYREHKDVPQKKASLSIIFLALSREDGVNEPLRFFCLWLRFATIWPLPGHRCIWAVKHVKRRQRSRKVQDRQCLTSLFIPFLKERVLLIIVGSFFLVRGFCFALGSGLTYPHSAIGVTWRLHTPICSLYVPFWGDMCLHGRNDWIIEFCWHS